jgi:NTE family protein
MSSLENEPIPKKQTAIVLQGGGALGAYEAGVVKAIFKKLKERNGSTPSFDIIAGTSIGAISASILANYFMQHNKWENATEKLQEFWNDVSTMTDVEIDPTFDSRWNYYHAIDPRVAKAEAARRFYAVRELLSYGARNVFGPPDVIPDNKFFDPLNTWYLYDSKPLEKLLREKYLTEFPLKTDPGQPRLLLVSVDILESVAVTFDSYKKDDGTRKTEYGKYGPKYIIRYNNGIGLEHVLASSAVPVFYNYKEIIGESVSEDTGDNNNSNKTDTRYFWDGILLSNTPLRELISEHQDFWENKIGTNLVDDMWKTDDSQENIRKVPDLDVYIVDIWPTRNYAKPINRDESVDRMNDIMSNDKTDYDETVATLVSDYIDFVKRMRNLAAEAINKVPDSNDKNMLQDQLKNIPQTKARSTKRTGERRSYEGLIKGRFKLNKVVRIERKEDDNTISSKWQDFSSGTITQLIDSGYREGSFQMDIYFQLDKVLDLIKSGRLSQDQADKFTYDLLKVRSNYLTPGKEDIAKTGLQKIKNDIQSVR